MSTTLKKLALPVLNVRTPEELQKQVDSLLKKMGTVSSWDRQAQNKIDSDLRNVRAELAIAEYKAGDAPESAGIPKPKFAQVRIDQIIVDGENSRIQSLEGDAQTVQLATNIATLGIQQPMGVHAQGKKFVLIWGHRRLAAALLNKMKAVPCFVYPKLEAEQVKALRSTENLQRRELNPIEEAMDVLRLMESVDLERTEHKPTKADEKITGKLPEVPGGYSAQVSFEDRIERVAEYLGKSEGWVRDRAYLARLTGDARQLVIDGKLPIAHARELAKIADSEIRDTLAREAARYEDGSGGITLYQLKSRMSQYVCSLAITPFKLDVPFAGKPACVSCPFNSANDPKLFTEQERPEKATCMNQGCYEFKTKKAQEMIEATVEKVAAAKKKDKDLSITENTIGTMIPDAIKATSAVRKAKKELEPEKAKPKTPAAPKTDRGWMDKRNEVVRKLQAEYREAEAKWSKAQAGKLAESSKSFERLMVLVVMEYLHVFNDLSPWRGDREVKKALAQNKDLFRLLKNGKIADIQKFAEKNLGMPNLRGLHPDAILALLDAVGAKADPLPNEKEYEAKLAEWDKANPKPESEAKKSKAKDEDEGTGDDVEDLDEEEMGEE